MLERSAVGYRSPLLAGLGVPHAFTTRPLDVGPLDGPLSEHLRRAAGVKLDTPILAPRQVHGGEVLRVDAGMDRLAVGDAPADGVWTEGPGALLLIRTADCVPVLLASADGARVAAVHAGWRGLVAGVLPAAVAALAGAGSGALAAAIGPCLSPARFEVGPEVADAFRAADLGAAVHERPGSRPHVDLAAAASLQLERGGVARIDRAGLCTWEGAAEFWSYRRDVTHGALPRTGRLAALIAAAPDDSPVSRREGPNG